jgi:hypothetical protein
MGFFKRDFSKAGPGVRKDEPRKKGIRRFFEIIAREYRDLMKINLLFTLVLLPSLVLFILGLFEIFSLGLGMSVIATYPIGGALAASMFCITRMLRDDPGFLWEDFKRKFRETLRQAGLTGVLCATFLYTQFFMFWLPLILGTLIDPNEPIVSPTWTLIGIILMILFNMFAPYMFLQFAYIKLNTFTIIKNSVLLALSNFGRSFMGAITGMLPWVVFILFIEVAYALIPLIPLIFFVFSWLLSLMWIWPVFDKHFSIEETIRKEQDKMFDDNENRDTDDEKTTPGSAEPPPS